MGEVEKLQALYDDEMLILSALNDAYHSNRLQYMHFIPAFDATSARAAALSYAIDDARPPRTNAEERG